MTTLATSGNLFADLEPPTAGEAASDLLRLALPGTAPGAMVRVERILSSASPEPILYDQTQDEWVVLLQGRARLWLSGRERELGPGDYLFIPAHTPHRVLETSAEPPCLWLAVHIYGGGAGQPAPARSSGGLRAS